MSSMLEQAIVDAAALREAALKNAEQSIIEKYAPQIKEAVNSLLEGDLINEQEVATSEPPAVSAIEAPLAASPMSEPNKEVELSITDEDQTWVLDLEAIKADMKEEGAPEEEEFTGTEELAGDLGLDVGEKTDDALDLSADEDLALNEIINVLSELSEEDEEEDKEEEVLEEELIVDMAGQHKNGTFESSEGTLKYQEEMQLAKEEATKHKEENEELEKKAKELKESVTSLTSKNKELLEIINQLDNSLKETLLSNAKLLYSNQTLSDASLNERQKSKIVEAIAQANTPEEAKTLQEALKTTVGTTIDSGPKSLSESVNRKSNLSGIMPRRKQPAQEYSFANQMKKLAGIK